MKYNLPIILHLTYKYIWISVGPTLRAGRRREGRGGTEGTRKGGKNSPCPPKHGGRSMPMLLVQQILLASELWVGHNKIAFFDLYSDGQVQLDHSLTRTLSVHTYERRLIGNTQLTLFPSSELWTEAKAQQFSAWFCCRVLSRGLHTKIVPLYYRSSLLSHRCINQHHGPLDH